MLKDGPWHPRQEKNPRSENYDSAEGIVKIMRADSPEVTSMVIANTSSLVISPVRQPKKKATTIRTPSTMVASSPDKGPLTSALTSTTPSARRYLRSNTVHLDDGICSTFLPEEPQKNKTRLTLPQNPSLWVKKSPVPLDSFEGTEYRLTLAGLNAVKKQKEQRLREGINVRKVSQKDLLKISATDACRKSGITVVDDLMQILDIAPHSCIGDRSRKVSNLGIGTRFSNALMELVNFPIKKVLSHKKIKALYLKVNPTFVERLKEIRLLEKIRYEIKDGPGNNYKRKATIEFDTLSLEKICLSEIKIMEKIITKKFSDLPIPKPKPFLPALAKLSKDRKPLTNLTPNILPPRITRTKGLVARKLL